MAILVTNNASAEIALSITPSDTTIILAAGQGVEFPSPGASDYFYATLVDSSNNLEIVKCTTRSADTLTVVRGQDGTAARSYGAGSLVELRLVAAAFRDLQNQTFTNILVTGIRETMTVSATAASGTINFDTLSQAVMYYTSNASSNWTLNVRGNSGATLNSVMGVGQSFSLTFMAAQGATAYYNNVLTVDGNTITPKWQSGTAPTSGNANGVDVYTYVIIKTADATFTVLASQTKFA